MKISRDMKIHYKIRRSRLWAFDRKHYRAIDNHGQSHEPTKKLCNHVWYSISQKWQKTIISPNGMIDDSNTYVNPASKKQNFEISTSESYGMGTHESIKQSISSLNKHLQELQVFLKRLESLPVVRLSPRLGLKMTTTQIIFY